MTKEELKKNIEKIDKGIKSGVIPENLLPDMKKKKAEFEKQLAELEKSKDKQPQKSDTKTINNAEELKKNIEKINKGIKSGVIPENLLPDMKKKKAEFEKQLAELEKSKDKQPQKSEKLDTEEKLKLRIRKIEEKLKSPSNIYLAEDVILGMEKAKDGYKKRLAELEKSKDKQPQKSDTKTTKTKVPVIKKKKDEYIKISGKDWTKYLKHSGIKDKGEDFYDITKEIERPYLEFDKKEYDKIIDFTSKPFETDWLEDKKGNLYTFGNYDGSKWGLMPKSSNFNNLKEPKKTKTASVLSRVIGDKTKSKLKVTGDIKSSQELLKIVKKELEKEGYKTELVIAPNKKTGRPEPRKEKFRYLPEFKNADVLYHKTDDALRTVLADVTDSPKEAELYKEEIDYATVIGKSIYVLLAETEHLVKAKRTDALEKLAKLLVDIIESAYQNDGGDKKMKNQNIRRIVNELTK